MTTGRPKHQPIDMEYFKYLKPDSLLSSRDLKEIFHFKSLHSVSASVQRNQLPKHDIELQSLRRNKQAMFYWKVKTIMDYIKNNFGVDL